MGRWFMAQRNADWNIHKRYHQRYYNYILQLQIYFTTELSL